MIIDWLDPRAWLVRIGAAAIVASVAYVGGRIHGGERTQAKWDKEKAQAIQVATEAKAGVDRVKARWADNVLDAEVQRKTNDQTLASARARAADLDRRLRDAETRGGGVPDTSIHACHQALASTRERFATCRGDLRALADEHDGRIEEIRQLTTVWPR